MKTFLKMVSLTLVSFRRPLIIISLACKTNFEELKLTSKPKMLVLS